MNTILIVMQLLLMVLVVSMVLITLSLNTKSEGLGAAVTGSSDSSYRGAVGVEEQKRRLLQHLAYSFMLLALVHGVTLSFA